jgi:hypothetical protein
MTKRSVRAVLLVGGLLLCASHTAAIAGVSPDEIDGLEAWWSADALSLANGGKVTVWADRTENKHDLKHSGGVQPDFYENWAGDKPIVYAREGTMSVADPFTLVDHTIFLVYRAEGAHTKGLFHGSSELRGIVLQRGDERFDTYNAGSAGSINYDVGSSPAEEFRVTALGRERGTLRAWLNGEEISSNTENSDPIEVSNFFFVKQTTYSKRSGNGLAVAEMLFYDRFLSGAERAAVTDYLSTKYGITVTAEEVVDEVVREGDSDYEDVWVGGLVQLSTTTEANVNADEPFVIPWDIQDLLDEPFVHDPGANNTRLGSDQDGTRVRLHVSLPLISSVPGTSVRVLFRLNGAAFLRGEGRSGPLGATEGTHRGSVTAEVIAPLSKGDYIEVVTMRAGAPGKVTIEGGTAVLIAEQK